MEPRQPSQDQLRVLTIRILAFPCDGEEITEDLAESFTNPHGPFQTTLETEHGERVIDATWSDQPGVPTNSQAPSDAMIRLLFTPAEDSTNESLELGPFQDVYFESNDLMADGEAVAWIFVEGATEMGDPANLLGHPDAGKWVITETERLYGRCAIKVVS